jgi:hypothetical protein
MNWLVTGLIAVVAAIFAPLMIPVFAFNYFCNMHDDHDY